MAWIEHIMRALAPQLCVQCGREGPVLCDGCTPLLQPAAKRCYRCGGAASYRRVCTVCRSQTPLQQLQIAAVYAGAAQQVVHRLKFERAIAAAEVMAKLMIPALKRDRFDLVVHVPTANTRVRQRGYDQAALIAKRISKQSGIPYAPLLWRLGRQRQLGQGGAVRRQQLRGTFLVRTPESAQAKRILIIDDVLTTGSTLEAAAHTLLEAGAKGVSGAVFAIAPREQRDV